MSPDRYVWLWLPGDTEPTLCGHLRWDGRAAAFAYVRSYRDNPRAIAVQPDWPLGIALGERLFPAEDDALPGFIDDVAPGRWGEYVLEKRSGRALNAMEALIEGFGDRTGALEFSARPDEPPATEPGFAELDQVAEVIDALDRGHALPAHLRLLFQHGPSLGGRRPKATVRYGNRSWVAKFSSVRDYDTLQPRREAFGLALARAVGVEVPDFLVLELLGRPVLLVERFDREATGMRRHLLSARTLQGLSERRMLDSASYPTIARLLRRSSDDASAAAQWFERMVFNIALGNTDDHGLNHLFGWNGRQLSLMPAFDLEQQAIDEDLRSHEMIIGAQGKASRFDNALSAAEDFGLKKAAARQRLETIVERCQMQCEAAIEAAGITDLRIGAELRRRLHLQDAPR